MKQKIMKQTEDSVTRTLVVDSPCFDEITMQTSPTVNYTLSATLLGGGGGLRPQGVLDPPPPTEGQQSVL